MAQEEVIYQLEGWWLNPRHAEVSSGKILNLKLPLMDALECEGVKKSLCVCVWEWENEACSTIALSAQMGYNYAASDPL